MKKILLIGCIMLFVFCAPRKTVVETEGLEEVIVFGEEETIDVSEAPVLPQPVEEEIVAPPELVMPPVEEEEITEMTLPPVIEEEPVMPIIPVIPVEETPPPEITEYIPPTLPTAPPTPSSTKVFGFRIQIFASSTENNASRVADDAKTSFPEYVYVEYVPPYYKVRIGDCLTREDAEILKNKALRLGYRGAFVIETMITP
jgi:hypothetical protein